MTSGTHSTPTRSVHSMSPFASTTSSSTWRKRSMLTSTIALLVCTLGLVDSACISLAGSKACPAYAGYQVDTSIAAEVKSGGIIMQPFNTLAEFDQAAMNATAFQTSKSCTGYNSSVPIPYQTTILCAYAVQADASLACPNNATTSTTMCISSCRLYEQELTSMVQRLCPTDSSAKDGVSTMKAICSGSDSRFWGGLQGNTSTCIDSTKNEAATCGLNTDIARCDYCKANETAACCADAASTCNYPSTSTTGSASSSTSGALVPPSVTPGGNDSGSKSGLSTAQLGGIIGGAVAGVILLAAVVFVCIRRSKRHNQSPYGTSAAAHGGKGAGVSRKLSNSSNGYNISNPKFQEEAFPIPMTTLPPINMEPKNLGPIHPSGAMMAGAAAGAGMAGIGAAAAVGAMGHDSTGKPSYCQALYPYQASMADELDLTPGDVVNVQRVFDDGWAVGMNMNTSNEGAFPVVCVMFVDESDLNQDDDEFEEVNMHSMPPMTLREEDQEGRRSPSQGGGNGRNSPRSSLPSRSSSPVHLPRRNSSIRDSTVIIPGSSLMTSSPLAGGSAGGGGRLTPTSNVRDTMLSDASSMNRWWEGEGNKQ